MIVIFIIFIILIVTLNFIKEEHFSNFCKVSNYDNSKKFTPINMIINEIRPFIYENNNEYLNVNLPVYFNELNKLVARFPVDKLENNVKEVEGVRYNLIDPPKINFIPSKIINNLPDRLAKTLIIYFEKELPKLTYKACNENNICSVKKKDIRILKIGNNKGIYVVEGQILFNLRDINFLIRFVISNTKSFTIHYLNVEGFNFNTISNDIDISLNNNVKIYREPIINTYQGDKTYLFSSNEDKILNKPLKNLQKNNLYRCYGKVSYNKFDCESKFDSGGKPNKKIGVWDKLCINNTDCPFYKKNKNFPNNFGKCNNGYCEIPLGATQISPTKFINEDKIICDNCKHSVYCCKEQKNDPKFKSPDYRFKNDTLIRNKYNL